MDELKHVGRKISRRRQSGSQLVEFALVLPILTILIFGICQYGFMFAAYITIRNASAVGARQAIINSNNVVAVAQAAVAPLLNPGSATVTSTPTNLTTGSGVSVQVTYQFPLIIPFVVPPFTSASRTRTLTATTVIQ